tara:strand:- start:238 stop:507 length:270 start_codon:yes stop_codon:yes gene_type:complete
MLKNLLLVILGAFCGLWLIWPKIITSKGWECTKDIISSSNEDLTDLESLVESLPNRIKLGLAVSPQTLIKRDNLTRMEKLRIVGDACFR